MKLKLNSMKFLFLALLAIMVMVAAPAAAQDSPFYPPDPYEDDQNGPSPYPPCPNPDDYAPGCLTDGVPIHHPGGVVLPAPPPPTTLPLPDWQVDPMVVVRRHNK